MTTKNPTSNDEQHQIERERAAKVLTGELETDELDGSSGGNKRILLALGGLNLVFAAGRGFLGVTGIIAGHEAAIDVFLVGGLGLLLVYNVSQLPQTDIHQEMYSRIVGWSLAGVLILLAVLVLIDFNPGGTINEPVQVIGIALSLGSVGGYAIGLNEARAFTRAREAERYAGEAEQHKRELERQNDRLDSFASMLTHELRNPLHIAQVYFQQANPRDAEAASKVEQALNRIEEMTEIIFMTARTTDPNIEWETVPLEDAIKDAWDEVSTESTSLIVETDQLIRADAIHLHHLLENLFGNAIKHGGNEVTVTVGSLPTGFYVEDDGVGIPAAERDAIFDAGHTTHEDGIGLGLTFVARLVETYDWDCEITESETGGARFEFTNVDLISSNSTNSN